VSGQFGGYLNSLIAGKTQLRANGVFEHDAPYHPANESGEQK